MRNAVLLNSGGMDTFLLAHSLAVNGVDARHVFVDVGQVYSVKERESAERIARTVGQPLNVMDGAKFAAFGHSTGIIPFRNAELILNAAQHGEHIYLGVIADEINSDKSPEFLRAMEVVLDISHRGQYWTEGRTFELLTPLITKTKTELVREYFARGGFRKPLMDTVSCYDGRATHCGRCSSCFKRWVALVNNGLDVRGHFRAAPDTWLTPEQWAAKVATYGTTRALEVLQALHTTATGAAVLAASYAIPGPGPVEAVARPAGG